MRAVDYVRFQDPPLLRRLGPIAWRPNRLNVVRGLVSLSESSGARLFVLEVLRGTAKHQYAAKRTALEAAYPELEMTKEVHERALAVQALLAGSGQRQGVRIPDLLIAACAELHGATVLHYDGDHNTIAAVTDQEVEWVVSPGTADATRK